jgi:hypothetical protein
VIIGTTQAARSHSPVWVVPGTMASRAAGSPRTSPLMPPPSRWYSSTVCSSRTTSLSAAREKLGSRAPVAQASGGGVGAVFEGSQA